MFILADFIDSLNNLDSLFDLEEQVIRCLREMFQEIVSKYLIQLDETLVSQIPSLVLFHLNVDAIGRQMEPIIFHWIHI